MITDREGFEIVSKPYFGVLFSPNFGQLEFIKP